MWRGVMIFLSFVLLLTGWGLYFYQRSVNKMYEEYLLDEHIVARGNSANSNKGEQIKEEMVGASSKREKEEKVVTEGPKSGVDPHQFEVLMAEKEELNQKYNQLLNRIEKIEKVYNQISEENKKLKTEIQKKDKKIAILNSQLSRVITAKQSIEIKLQSMEGEVNAVRLENKVLKAKVAELNSVLNSMDKLKQAMRDLKLKMYFERKRKKEEARKHIVGNRGYIILNGRPTLGALGKKHQSAVEVIPVFD